MKTKIEIDSLILSATNKVEKCRQEWFEANTKLHNMLIDAQLTHSSLPNNYWLETHKAAAKLTLAGQLLASLKEIKEEMENKDG